MICDMHIHSNCSDGTFPPEELIDKAREAGVKAIALCDHNTVAGLSRFVKAAEKSDVIAVPGVEVTAAYNGTEIHILGLFIKEKFHRELAEYLAAINERKTESNKELAKRLKAGGYDIEYEAVLARAGEAIPNRSQFAGELVAKGYVSNTEEAFATILAEGGEFYKPPEKFDALEVIGRLASVEAVPVLAHPLLQLSEEKLRDFLPKAKAKGLAGMETIYPLFSAEETALAEALAAEYGLIPSGGSDFHGETKPKIKIGRGKDNIEVPFERYERLKDASLAVVRTHF